MSQTAPSLTSDVRLPRAVRERSARIAAMLESQADSAAAPTPPANEPAIEAADTSQVPASPAAPAQADPRESDPQYWAQRFRVTQGMLDRERRDRVADQERMQRDIAELREQLRAAQQQQPTPTKIDVSQFFTPEQIEQYGPEQCETLAGVAIKAAREETQSAIAARLKPLEDQQAANSEQAKREAQQRFIGALAEAVPDYEDVDASDGWKLWLAEEDASTGEQRQQMLDRHVARGRADLTARMFKAYKATLAAPMVPPVSAGNRAGPPAEPPSANRPTKGFPTQAEIKGFYTRAAIGKVKDQERSEFEARMQLQRPAA